MTVLDFLVDNTETLNAERAIASSNQPGKAANRLDEVNGGMLRRTPLNGGIDTIYSGIHLPRT